jgi:hypothetical protein
MVGCSDSAAPTQPTPTVERFLSVGCALAEKGYQCSAGVLMENASPRDVTGLSTWSTSDTSIATVNSVGFVTVLRIGDVAVRARYQDLDGFQSMRVEPGGLSYYHTALSGWVTDAQSGAKLDSVTVSILDGPNSGRTTSTHRDGAYQLYELQPGTFRVRFSRSGYVTSDRPFTLPGDRLVSLDAALTRSSS